jgi:hypothetical protein
MARFKSTLKKRLKMFVIQYIIDVYSIEKL